MDSTHIADIIIDCRNLLCPLPVIRTRQAIDQVAVGQTVMVLATDPASAHDMPAFAANTGHELLEATVNDGVFEYVFRKKEVLTS